MSTVLITGANKGIGLELARQLSARGDDVIACCRNPAAATDLNKLDKARVVVKEVHVGDADSVAKLKSDLGDRPIDVLINNAGAAGPAPQNQSALQMDYDGWMDTFAINTMAPLRMVQTFHGNLKAGTNAKAVTITSQMGALDLNMPVMYAYCSSKAAVNKVMRMLSTELAKDGVAVTLIHPGWVKTDMGGAGADITAQESAAGIISVVDGVSVESTGRFYKWNGEGHAW
ncbi:MAG: SDR family oxidoreductase [Proteobacteria bacterium]|nr:SDR family oxidoreductase [Pseudomonadota bacterium]